MPNSPSSSNQNVNHIYQAIATLGDTLNAKIDTVLQGIEGRVSKVEMRMDRMEEIQRLSTQWEVNEHKELVEHMTNALQTAEHRIMDKLDQRDDDLKQTEIRLTEKIGEVKDRAAEHRVTDLVGKFGWILAIGLYVLGYVLSHLPR